MAWCPVFSMKSGDQIQVLMTVWQALSQMNHPPSPPTLSILKAKQTKTSQLSPSPRDLLGNLNQSEEPSLPFTGIFSATCWAGLEQFKCGLSVLCGPIFQCSFSFPKAFRSQPWPSRPGKAPFVSGSIRRFTAPYPNVRDRKRWGPGCGVPYMPELPARYSMTAAM